MTKLFFDLEFTGLHQYSTPISLGIVSQTGPSFYAEFSDYDPAQLSPWLCEQVLPHLRLEPGFTIPFGTPEQIECSGNREMVRQHLEQWLAPLGSVEMWGDSLAYDWVLFCELFGGAREIPKQIFYMPFDLATLIKIKGLDPDVNRERFAFGETQRAESPKHNALWDAEVTRACYQKLVTL